mgnify:CR=1 FL=1
MGKHKTKDSRLIEAALSYKAKELCNFLTLCQEVGLGGPDFEYRFCARKWAFDFAWPEHLVALEVEGGIWSGGRHIRPKSFLADMDKYNAAAALGWRVIRMDSERWSSPETVHLLKTAAYAFAPII